MSTTKIIKGYVQRECDRYYPHQDDSIPIFHESDDFNDEPATLYIGPGKVWTEDEVQAELSSKDAEIEALRNPWISVKDRLPEPHTLVVLLNEDRRWVSPDDMVANVYAVGWLNSIHGKTYWSIPGERGSDISAYTHWMPLPPPLKP